MNRIAESFPLPRFFAVLTSTAPFVVVNMKEVIFEQLGSQPIIGEVERPSPQDDQILVKSLWTAMNPV